MKCSALLQLVQTALVLTWGVHQLSFAEHAINPGLTLHFVGAHAASGYEDDRASMHSMSSARVLAKEWQVSRLSACSCCLVLACELPCELHVRLSNIIISLILVTFLD